jgi:hypothetical protein
MRVKAPESLTVCLNHESDRRRGRDRECCPLAGLHREGIGLDRRSQAWRRRAHFDKVGNPPLGPEAAALPSQIEP